MEQFLEKLKKKQNLSFEESKSAFELLMTGKASENEIYDFLTLLSEKGEVADEIAGGVYVLREKSKRVNVTDCVDTCGTGGDGMNTLNISTASALLLASMGTKVAKHGNKAVSSKCGSGDVLEALKIKIDLEPSNIEKEINNAEFFNPNISIDEFKSLAEKGQMRQARTFNQDVKDVINKKMPANIFEITGKNAYDYESGNFVRKLEKAGLYVDDDKFGTVIAGKTKKDVERLKQAQTPIEHGLSYGYKPEDIAKFYVNRRGNQADIGYAEFLNDLKQFNKNIKILIIIYHQYILISFIWYFVTILHNFANLIYNF